MLVLKIEWFLGNYVGDFKFMIFFFLSFAYWFVIFSKA